MAHPGLTLGGRVVRLLILASLLAATLRGQTTIIYHGDQPDSTRRMVDAKVGGSSCAEGSSCVRSDTGDAVIYVKPRIPPCQVCLVRLEYDDGRYFTGYPVCVNGEIRWAITVAARHLADTEPGTHGRIYVTGLETPSSAEITLIDQADVWMGPGGCEGADGCGCKCPVDGPAEGQVTANLGEVGSAGARGTDTGRLVMRQEATASNLGRAALRISTGGSHAVTRDASGRVEQVRSAGSAAGLVVEDAPTADDPLAYRVTRRADVADPSSATRRWTVRNVMVSGSPVLSLLSEDLEHGTSREARWTLVSDGVTDTWEMRETRGDRERRLVHAVTKVAEGTYDHAYLEDEGPAAPAAGAPARAVISEHGERWETIAGLGPRRTLRWTGPAAGPRLTTAYEYYASGETGAGRLKRVTSPTGAVTDYTYLSNGTSEVTHFEGRAGAREVRRTWASAVTTTVEKVDGAVVSWTESQLSSASRRIERRRATVVGAAGVPTDWLRDYRWVAATGGYICAEDRADGTVATRSLAASSGILISVEASGAGVAGRTRGTLPTAVARGTESTGVRNAEGVLADLQVRRIEDGLSVLVGGFTVESWDASQLPTSVREYVGQDASGAPLTSTWALTTVRGEHGPVSETDRDGAETVTAYDPLGRVSSVTANGVTRRTEVLGTSVSTWLVGSDGVAADDRVTVSRDTAGFSETTTRVYRDAAGATRTTVRQLDTAWHGGAERAALAAAGKATADAADGTESHLLGPDPGLGQQVPEEWASSWNDGSPRLRVGNLGTAVTVSRAIVPHAADGVRVGSLVTTATAMPPSATGWTTTAETSQSTADLLGRVASESRGGIVSRTVSYDSRGLPASVADGDGVVTLSVFDEEAVLRTTATDIDRNGSFGPSDPAVTRLTALRNRPGEGWVWRTTTSAWRDGDTAAHDVAYTERSLDGLRSWSGRTGSAAESTFAKVLTGPGDWTERSVAPDGTAVLTTVADGRPVTVERIDAAGATVWTETATYDALGRQASARHSRHPAASTVARDGRGLVTSVTDAAGNQATVTLDQLGREVARALPPEGGVARVTSTSYWADGTVSSRSGFGEDAAYSLWRDAQGRVTRMEMRRRTTLAPDPTTWSYDDRGLLASKLYANGTGESYSRTAGGRLLGTLGARGVSSSRGYDQAGRLTSVGYSDGTPSVAIAYDRLGRPVTVSNGVASYAYAYDADTLLPVAETTTWDVNGDLIPDAASARTRSVTRDAILRETGWDLGGEHAVSQAFDAAGRLASVTANGVTHAVAYVASSDLVASVSAPGLSVTRSWEPARDLLSGVSASGGSTVSHAYVNDAAGLRRSADASYPGQAGSTGDLSWLRDAAGRVTRETGTLPSTSSWTYDNAGNRLTAASGGTTLSLTTDSLNRYVSTGSGNATHDADGNLTYDPQVPRAVSPACKFTWDAENRMTEARNFSGVSQVRLGYDAYGRLVRREHTSPLATGAGRAKVELYAHVGGLRVAVYSGNTSTKAVTLIRAIAWGPDLSGTVGGAGGIGGLLSVRETSASTSSRKGLTMLLGHDAKGDVTSVWSADGAYLGGYVTQAFGQVTILSGSSAYLSENQWRLASKPLEWLTGYSHWGRRWYSPFLGRWVSRDPIGEAGGVNLYGACGNDMVSGLDPWGEAGVALPSPKLGSEDFSNKVPTQLPEWLGGDDRVINEGNYLKRWNWRRVIAGNRADDVAVVLNEGCSLTVVFHGCDDRTGCVDPAKKIEDIIKLIQTALAKSSTYCPKGARSITLASCYGAINGNAQAIADATGLPVVAGTGKVNARYQAPGSSAAAVLYVDSVLFDERGSFQLGALREAAILPDFMNSSNSYSSPDKSMQWVVVRPNKPIKITGK